MGTYVDIQTSVRDKGLDGIRGFAVLLMVLDHAVKVYGGPLWVTEYVTILAMPLFMLVAGHFWKPNVSDRILQVVLAAGLSIPLVHLLGLAHVPILAVFLLVWPLLALSAFMPLTLASLAVLQFWYFPVGWSGYEPGLVLIFLIIGQVLSCSRYQLGELEDYGRHFTRFALAGRYPLTLYIGHLFVLTLSVHIL